MNTLILCSYKLLIQAAVRIIDVPEFLEFISRFLLNAIVIMILVRWLYYTSSKRKDYLFTYILVSTVVFLLCYLLESVTLQIGFALGLFAIFGIIRYRTNQIPIKEMTYLFLVIGISVINALANSKTSIVEVLFTNMVIVAITYSLEKLWLLRHECSKVIVYEKINLAIQENHEDLIKDLQERTGIKKINRIETGKIDLSKDICILTIYYDSADNGINETEFSDNDQETV